MSDRVTISSQDISDLVSALQGLTVVVTRIARSAELSRASATPLSVAEQEGWEVVEDEYQTSELLAEEVSSSALTLEVSPSSVPTFCYDLAKHRLTGASIGSAPRAERAFFAGRRAKESLRVGSRYLQADNIGLQPAHWICLKSSKISAPRRVTTKRDLTRLTGSSESGVVWEQFPTITELQIFCVGLGIPIPPLVRWKNKA